MYGSLNEKYPNNKSNHLQSEVVAMTKKLYPHFNPEVHKIESKIATVRTSHHCKYNINYNIIQYIGLKSPNFLHFFQDKQKITTTRAGKHGFSL